MHALKMLRGLGLLVGMIIGAGIFALPYAVSEAGFIWSGIHFAVVAVIVTLVHILYGNILYDHPEHHRLPGYIRSSFGKWAAGLALISRLFSYYGSLLAYGALAGTFLSFFNKWASEFEAGIYFFLAISFLLFLNLKRAGTINFLLTVPLVIFPFVLSWFIFSRGDFNALQFLPERSNWFLPYGIFLFAMSGASVIPEVIETLGRKKRSIFRGVVILGTLVVSLVYIVFTITILSVAGSHVPKDALSVLRQFDGGVLLPLGVVIGLLAIATSHLALGLELRYTFEYDLFLKKKFSWALVTFVPLILFTLGFNDFVLVISFIGAIGIGVEGILITLLSRKVSRTNIILVGALLIIFAAGALFEIVNILGYI
ncbi:MAG: hypothetical protein UY14_C0028G0006 [Parcubacteria group bacterium GW2011_GWA1_47_9]|nr:MAG: hypothetical protein UY14_C0028G0006 [Parcubacteria group bacterium GW2011_GWA1_47_9]